MFVFTLSGIPRVSQCKFNLPLRLVCYPSSAVKNAKYKITVDTNKPPVNLNEVFPGTTAKQFFFVILFQSSHLWKLWMNHTKMYCIASFLVKNSTFNLHYYFRSKGLTLANTNFADSLVCHWGCKTATIVKVGKHWVSLQQMTNCI